MGEALTIQEAAKELGRSTPSVRNYVRHFGLSATKRGVQFFIEREDLEAWRAKPEVVEMMAAGDAIHGHRKRRGVLAGEGA